MPAIGVGPQGVTPISPPARASYTKVVSVTAADGSTAFEAFGLPKDAVVIGVYSIAHGANTTQTVSLGFTSGGTDIVNALKPDSTGYSAVGDAAGASVGVKLTEDKKVYAKASATLTNPVIVQVE